MNESINLDKISELKEIDQDGSNETLKKLIEHYLSSTPQKLKKMAESYYLKDFAGLRKEANSLNASSNTLGAIILASLAKEIEYAKNTPELEAFFGQTIKKANIEFESVKLELQKFL